MIFVFGSNEAGIHGRGAAHFALVHKGARLYQGFGMAGNSYAIPTKDHNLKPLSLDEIANYVAMFIDFALANPHLAFQVSRIGCGYAGYADCQIAYMFKPAPRNCYFDTAWMYHLNKDAKFWGHYV